MKKLCRIVMAMLAPLFMTASAAQSKEYSAQQLGLTGSGDETKLFQQALDRLAASAPAVLRLEAGRTYTVCGLAARAAVTLRGEKTTLQTPTTTADGVYLLTAGPGAEVTLDGLTLRGNSLLRGQDNGIIRLNQSALETSSSRPVFLLTDKAQLAARDSSANSAIGIVQDRATLEWTGGAWQMSQLNIFDGASATLDTQAPDQPPGTPPMECNLNFGRPSGGRTSLQHWQCGFSSGPLWEALCGTVKEFNTILNNPAQAAALEAWQAHNATQCGRGQLTLRNRPESTSPIHYNVYLCGRFTVDLRDSVLQRLNNSDQATVTMRGGRLRRCEAYGLSTTTFTNVNLIMDGSNDPRHPTTDYYQGNHCMEFTQAFNDLLPTVIFQGGQIDFAGDDCLNGLPEARALQLMEVAHDLGSLFPNFKALEAFAPETRQPGARLAELKGQAGATHNEATKPVVPFDFTSTGFMWQGDYQAGRAYRIGDVCAHDNILYVCNRDCTNVIPNLVFNHWQAWHVGFRNDKGYLQVARRVSRDGRWQWERRQALGPWAGYTLRERGNPIVTYQVHLILRDTVVIRRANTWSYSISDVIPAGNSAYNYVLSTKVSNVNINKDYNRVECYNVELRNVGVDAPPPIRGLSLGPNRYIPARYVFENVRVVGESIGAPIIFRIDSEPLRPDNTFSFKGVIADYNPNLPTATDYGERRHPLNASIGAPMQRVVASDAFTHYEFMSQPPPDWRGIQDYLGRVIDPVASADFLKEHPGLVPGR